MGPLGPLPGKVMGHGTMTRVHHKSEDLNEQGHEISNNVVCATSKASDQPAHICSRIRAIWSY